MTTYKTRFYNIKDSSLPFPTLVVKLGKAKPSAVKPYIGFTLR
jgi:hypothetical protein